ncbi:MAG: hypothetical protein PGN33_14220 [Methylobacterium radiotolerans]
MAQHTPGPWQADAQYIAAVDGRPVPIAASQYVWVTAPGGPAHEEACANARLIAAAPDLLAALRWAASMAEEAILVRENGGDPEDTPEVIAMHREELEAARAAITKAEGQ